ncbi:hypothetical protein D4R75_08960 [bacterium]|nr:MAG: hypothetical protein D4R75_08960 [bacterium]
MGTSTIFDIIGSAIVAGMLLLTALRLNAQANETTLVYNGSVRLQQNMVALVEWVEHDFRRIGYCKNYTKIPFPTQSIRVADSSNITFWTDDQSTGNLDSVRWYIGPTSEMSSTPNPRDRKIYRKINNTTPVGWNLGVTQFKLEYYNYAGTVLTTPVAQPSAIYSMQISIVCESPFTFQEQYRATKTADSLADFQVQWRQLRMAAKNLRNR